MTAPAEVILAARLTRAQVSAALKRARRRGIPARATAILAALRSAQLGQPPATTAAYAVTARTLIAVIPSSTSRSRRWRARCGRFSRHPDAEIYLSQPGLGFIPGARVLGEFGDDPHPYTSGKARKNYTATSPITRASSNKKTVMARFVRNDWLTDALMAKAFASLSASPGSRALYDAERAGGSGHHPALRKLANRLAGILHGWPEDPHPLRRGHLWPEHETSSPLDI